MSSEDDLFEDQSQERVPTVSAPQQYHMYQVVLETAERIKIIERHISDMASLARQVARNANHTHSF